MDKYEQFAKADNEFFKTPVYGITEDVESTTLHVTISKEYHELILESLQELFPDEEFQPYCVPLSDELDIERIIQNMKDKLETVESVESE
ncbi:MAG: hypothetical protein V3U54_05935 [Thermodesulfobacteriota bacterium]